MFYELEALGNRWSVRELKRQIGSLLFERVGLSVDKEGVLALAHQSTLSDSPTEMTCKSFCGARQTQETLSPMSGMVH